MRFLIILITTLLCGGGTVLAEECKFEKTYEDTYKVFETKDKALVFKAKFYVNTDGSVKSYHKLDIRGQSQAINNVCNGVNVVALDARAIQGEATPRAQRCARISNWPEMPAGRALRRRRWNSSPLRPDRASHPENAFHARRRRATWYRPPD